MAEVRSELGYVPHHQKKLIFVLSAMRHFAQSLQEAGVRLIYRRADAPQPPASFTEALADAIDELQPERLIVTHPGEYRVLEVVKSWQARFALPVEIREDSRFLCTAAEFNAWAEGRKSLRMEFFYREMRQRHRVLMDGGQPVGGQWNYDTENRKPPRGGLEVPAPFRIPPDAITQRSPPLSKPSTARTSGPARTFTLPSPPRRPRPHWRSLSASVWRTLAAIRMPWCRASLGCSTPISASTSTPDCCRRCTVLRRPRRLTGPARHRSTPLRASSVRYWVGASMSGGCTGGLCPTMRRSTTLTRPGHYQIFTGPPPPR